MEKQSGNTPAGCDTVSAADIKAAAKGAGFSMCGIAAYRTLPEHSARLEQWLKEGRQGNLGYLERNSAKRGDPHELMPGTRTVVVCAVNYRNGAWRVPADGRPKIASYAFPKDYHVSIKRMLKQMLQFLQSRYPALKGRPLTDTAPIFEKAWAVEAGLGWIGRNSLLITREFGSAVLLGELLIDAPADIYDSPYIKDGCGACCRCVDSCPNNAISGCRTIDTTRCISRLTVEPDPPSTGLTFDDWVFGCDACQMCCPHNGGKPDFSNPLFTPVIEPASVDTYFWEKTTFDEFVRLFADTPLERPGIEAIYERAKNMHP